MNHTLLAGRAANVFVGLLSLLPADTTAQVTNLSPTAVIDLNQIVQRDLKVAASKPIAVAQREAQWAVLMGHAVVVTGNAEFSKAFLLEGAFDQIAIDQDRHIHLRYVQDRASAKSTTKALVVDLNGAKVNSFTMPASGAHLVVTGPMVKWKTSAGVFDARDIPSEVPLPALSQDPNFNVQQRVYQLGIPGDKFITFGAASEQVTLFTSNSVTSSSTKIQLDSAYDRIGIPVTHHDPTSGEIRFIWATTSPRGLLYVCLSDTPMSGPAYIAAFDPTNGRIVDVLSTFLPSVQGRKEQRFNPKGTMMPGLGAAGDQLVIVDPEMAIIAVYPSL